MTRARTGSSSRGVAARPNAGRAAQSTQFSAQPTPAAVTDPAWQPAFLPPYSPSWFDKVIALVETLPGSYVVWYGFFAVLLFALATLSRITAGQPPFGGDLANRAFSCFMSAFPAFLMHSLNRTAADAFAVFESALVSAQEAPLLRYRLTTAPAVPSLVFSLGGASTAVLLLVASAETRSFTEAIYGPGMAVYFFGALTYFINSHGAYRVSRQLTQVSRIYDLHARVRLGDLGPHFALSRLTSRAAIASILVVSGYLVGFAQLGSLTLSLAVLIPNLMLASAAFVLPLAGAHRLLEAERYRARREATQKMEVALSRLHEVIERGDFAAVPR